MPGNLEFISPPFLISAPVIQINSNEISRGKAPFGWGVCSSLQLTPVQRPSSPSEGPNNPPTAPTPSFKVGPLQHVEERIWAAVTHTRGASSVSASRGSRRFSVKTCAFPLRSASAGGTTEGEIRRRRVLTNGQTAGDFVLFPARLRWIIGVVFSVDPGWRSYTPYDLNKQRLFVCARRRSTEGAGREKKKGRGREPG